MTTKILTGTHASGYALGAPLTTLSIATSGYVQGTGISTSSTVTQAYTVANLGRIAADDYNATKKVGYGAVYLGHGGSVINGGATDPTAEMENWRGVYIEGASGSVTNYATIIGHAGTGIVLNAGGIVLNGSQTDKTALIQGGHYSVPGGIQNGFSQLDAYSDGIYTGTGTGTVDNFGTITGGNGIWFYYGGLVTNHAGAKIIGDGSNQAVPYSAVAIYATTVLNAGIIATYTNNIFPVAIGLREGYGDVVNYQGGTISGGCVEAEGAFSTINNSGDIDGSIAMAYGILVNQKSGNIDGQVTIDLPIFAQSKIDTLTNAGIILNSVLISEGSVINSGVISGSLTFYSGSTLDNKLGGNIDGAVTFSPNERYTNGTGYLVNYGQIGGVITYEHGSITNTSDGIISNNSAQAGVYMKNGGFLSNEAGGLISGNVGVIAMYHSTLVNYGTLSGSSDAVVLKGPAAVLRAETGSVFEGVIAAGSSLIDFVSGISAASGIVSSGTIDGAGALRLNGGASSFSAGARLDLAEIIIAGAGTTVKVDTSLTFAKVWDQSGGTLSLGKGDRLTLAGTTVLGGAINGPGAVGLTSATVDALTIGGAAVVAVAKTVSQSGTVTLGDTVAGASTISISKTGLWEMGSGSIAKGTGGAGKVTVYGELIKDAGTGISAIGVTTFDYGTVEAATGTLDFANLLYGTGALKIDAGATLEADRSTFKTLTVDFDGTGATLAMRFAKTFAATISGFTASDTLDLMKTKATGASVNGSDQLVIVNGSTTVATLQLAGSYSRTTFSAGSDGNGGTDITIASAGSVPPPDLPRAPSPRLMVMAMAAMVSPSSPPVTAHDPATVHSWMLARPGTQVA